MDIFCLQRLLNTAVFEDFLIDRSTDNAVLVELERNKYHENFCVDYSSSEGEGAAAAAAAIVGFVCEPRAEYACQFKPCMRLCCPRHQRLVRRSQFQIKTTT
jgi:hypothetical protein